MPVERLPGGGLVLARRGVAGGGGCRLAASSTMKVGPASVPHLLLFLIFLIVQVVFLLGAPEVGDVAGQGR